MANLKLPRPTLIGLRSYLRTQIQVPNRRPSQLLHIDFPGITTFENGLAIQKKFTDVQLKSKELEFEYRRSLRKVEKGQLNPEDLKAPPSAPLPKILTFEYENVYTGGLRSKHELSSEDIANFEKVMGCKYHQLERGGQTTWHGRGQLVSYLIMDLKSIPGLTTKKYVNDVLLKSAQSVLLDKFGIESIIGCKNPGLWVKNRDQVDNDKDEGLSKIGSVGIRVRHGITDFGISLNIKPDLKYLNTFEMCGMKDAKQTSIKEQLSIIGSNKATPTVPQLAQLYVAEIGKALEMEKVIEEEYNIDLEIE